MPLYFISTAGCREGGGLSQQGFKGLDDRDAAPSFPSPAPGSANWYPGGGGMQGTCALETWGGTWGLGREKEDI